MNEQTALVTTNQAMTWQETVNLGKTLAESGFFKDADDAAKAIVKVLAGRELGFGPIASMTGIHIVNGKPALGANLIAAKIKGSGRYTFRIAELTVKRCELAIIENGQELQPRSVFSIEDAVTAGLTTGKNAHSWKKYPRNMLFARAVSNAARWHCPELFSGAPPYTPEELGAEVDGDGEMVNITPTPRPPVPATTTSTTPSGNGGNAGNKPTNGNGEKKRFGLSEAAMKALLDSNLADGSQNAAHMVNLSDLLDKDSTTEEIVAWAKLYRAARDEGAEPQDAAKRADVQAALEVAAEAGDG